MFTNDKIKPLLRLSLVFILVLIGVRYVLYPYDHVDIDPRYEDKVGTKEFPRFKLVKQHEVDISSSPAISWSKDSQRFAQTGSAIYTIWSREGELLHENMLKGTLTPGATISQDGQFVFLNLGFQNIILMVDVKTNKVVRNIPGVRPRNNIEHIAFSPDGERMIVIYFDSTVGVYDTLDWSFLFHLKNGGYGIRNFAISPDNKHFAAGNSKGEVSIWNYRSGQKEYEFQAHTGGVSSLVYNEEGTFLITGSTNTQTQKDLDLIRLWSVKNWSKQLSISEGMEGGRAIHALDVSDQHHLIAVGTSRDFLRLYNLNNGQLVQRLPIDFVAKSIRFSPDGQFLAAATDFSIFLWKIE